MTTGVTTADSAVDSTIDDDTEQVELLPAGHKRPADGEDSDAEQLEEAGDHFSGREEAETASFRV